MAKPILLDTCAFIWLMNGDQRAKTFEQDLEASARSGLLYICPITVWEISVKAAKGKLEFNQPVYDWIKTAKRRAGIQNTILSDDIMYHSTILPGNFHKDPADRLIVATAIADSLTLATGDRKILDWGHNRDMHLMAL